MTYVDTLHKLIFTMLRTYLAGLAAVLFAAAFLLIVSCGDSDDDNTPAATTPVGNGANGDGEVCGSVPPQTGEGPDGLEGAITYVRLATGCEPDVYITSPSGDNARAVVTHPAYDDEADLSPDGSRVVFFSARSGTQLLYVVNADGSGLRQLTEGDATDVSPRWSPDGSRIAFSHNGSIAVINPDGAGMETLLEALPGSTEEPCRVGLVVGGWSPDGARIVYYSHVLRSEGNLFWICALDVASGEIEMLAGEPTGALHAEPHWSPDGTKIVFRDDRETIEECNTQGFSGCNYEIYVLDLETGEETNVSNHPALDIEPVWSPDGEWILFASDRDDPRFDLYVMRADGSDVQRILSDPASKDSYPSWR